VFGVRCSTPGRRPKKPERYEKGSAQASAGRETECREQRLAAWHTDLAYNCSLLCDGSRQRVASPWCRMTCVKFALTFNCGNSTAEKNKSAESTVPRS
jgi:hypothetical protein